MTKYGRGDLDLDFDTLTKRLHEVTIPTKEMGNEQRASRLAAREQNYSRIVYSLIDLSNETPESILESISRAHLSLRTSVMSLVPDRSHRISPSEWRAQTSCSTSSGAIAHGCVRRVCGEEGRAPAVGREDQLDAISFLPRYFLGSGFLIDDWLALTRPQTAPTQTVFVLR
jgi:hypothetical protein